MKIIRVKNERRQTIGGLYCYGKGWDLCVHSEVEYEHYERLGQITLEEFLNESP